MDNAVAILLQAMILLRIFLLQFCRVWIGAKLNNGFFCRSTVAKYFLKKLNAYYIVIKLDNFFPLLKKLIGR